MVLAAVLLVAIPLAPATLAAPALSVSTPYPAVSIAPGSQVTFDMAISTAEPERVDVSLTGAPDAWNAELLGGGFVVNAVETDGKTANTVRVSMTVPATQADGATTIVFHAAYGSVSEDVPLVVKVSSAASGKVTLTSDFPSLKGPSSQSFDFNLTLANGTAQDLTFSVNAQGPTGWTIAANLTGQTQAASAVVKAGSSSGVTVSATPPSSIAAGAYKIDVVATAGGQTYSGSLEVDITGTYTLAVSTSSGALNGHGPAGSGTAVAVTLTNNGTADITNVKLSDTAPTNWDVSFDKPTVATIPAGQTVTVNATVKPASAAIAGDYTVTISASGDPSVTGSMDIRYTVDTSVLGGIAGIALIVAIVAGVWWVFQRYGRR